MAERKRRPEGPVYGNLAYDLDALVRERALEEAGRMPEQPRPERRREAEVVQRPRTQTAAQPKAQVSPLVLGSAAVDAGLTHPLMLIVVAVASLGSYAVPDYSLGLALRIGQLLLLAAGCVFGVYGVVLFVAVAAVRLCSLTSLGAPYAAPVAPRRVHNPDLMTRMPLWLQRRRGYLASAADQPRAQGSMRAWKGRERR